jgi:hypothetical protein
MQRPRRVLSLDGRPCRHRRVGPAAEGNRHRTIREPETGPDGCSDAG